MNGTTGLSSPVLARKPCRAAATELDHPARTSVPQADHRADEGDLRRKQKRVVTQERDAASKLPLPRPNLRTGTIEREIRLLDAVGNLAI